jgi:hypothetical protein
VKASWSKSSTVREKIRPGDVSGPGSEEALAKMTPPSKEALHSKVVDWTEKGGKDCHRHFSTILAA